MQHRTPESYEKEIVNLKQKINEYEDELDEDKRKSRKIGGAITGSLAAFILLIAAGMVGCPAYNVHAERMRGQAELARAESNKLILVEEANAQMAAAESLAQAEIIRARGLAEATRIIGDSLQDNEAYLRYLFIMALKDANAHGNQIIYIPTEAGLPILEASRLGGR